MAKQTSRKWRKPRTPAVPRDDLNRLLDVFLAFDRVVVELNMAIYNVSRRDQVLMRRQNRCLHETLRTRLPQVLALPSRSTPLRGEHLRMTSPSS